MLNSCHSPLAAVPCPSGCHSQACCQQIVVAAAWAGQCHTAAAAVAVAVAAAPARCSANPQGVHLEKQRNTFKYYCNIFVMQPIDTQIIVVAVVSHGQTMTTA